jgi:hypothetical protein
MTVVGVYARAPIVSILALVIAIGILTMAAALIGYELKVKRHPVPTRLPGERSRGFATVITDLNIARLIVGLPLFGLALYAVSVTLPPAMQFNGPSKSLGALLSLAFLILAIWAVGSAPARELRASPVDSTDFE